MSCYSGSGDVDEDVLFLATILKGIRIAAVSTLDAESKAKLQPSGETVVVEGQTFYKSHYSGTDRHYVEGFEVKDYSPHIFEDIRRISSIDTLADFIPSWTFEDPSTIPKPKLGAGKSGSLFFVSQDKRFIFKTIPQREAFTLVSVLRHLHEHFASHPGSRMLRYYGLHRFQQHVGLRGITGKKIYIVVMDNILYTPFGIDYKFDLKGRTPKAGKHLQNKTEDPKTYVFKDKDLDRTFGVDSITHEYLLHVLRADTDFLKKFNCMDYSLLVAVHQLQTEDIKQLSLNSSGEGRSPTLAIAPPNREVSVTPMELEKVFEKKRDQKAEEKREGIVKKLAKRRKQPHESDVQYTARIFRRQQKKIAQLQKQKDKKEARAIKKNKSNLELDVVSGPVREIDIEAPFYFKDPIRSAGVTLSDISGSEKPELYFISIIDYLSRYTFRKKAAHFVKRILWRSDELSTIPSNDYASRFLNYAGTIFKTMNLPTDPQAIQTQTQPVLHIIEPTEQQPIGQTTAVPSAVVPAPL